MDEGERTRTADEIVAAACRRLGIDPRGGLDEWPSIELLQAAFWDECTIADVSALLSSVVRTAILGYVDRCER